MDPDKEFELRRILFGVLTFLSWFIGTCNGILFYNPKKDPAWFASSIILPSLAILIQNAWSVYLVSRPYNSHIYNIWWSGGQQGNAPRKRNVFLFIAFFGYLNIHHDVRNKRHDYDASLVTLTTWHACVHWIPSLLYQTYICNNVGYCHVFQLLYMILLGICVSTFLALILHRYTQYHIWLIWIWLVVKLFVTAYPIAVFMTLKGTGAKTEKIYAWWGIGATVLVVGHTLLQIFAKHISMMQSSACSNLFSCFGRCSSFCRSGPPDAERRTSKSPQPKWRLGTILILASSVVSFASIVSCTGRFMEKASRTNGTQNLDDHENCLEMLTALRNQDCKELRTTTFIDKADCIGSPTLAKICPYYPPWWVVAADFENSAGPFVFGGIMIFFLLVTSEFFLVICLLVCLKGSDKILKKREIKLERKGSTKKSANEDVVNSVSSQDQEEATTETTAMIVASSKEADRVSTGERHTESKQVVARIDFDDGFLNFKKGDEVQFVDLAPEHEMFWRVEFGGNQSLVHIGFFQDVPGFVFEKCRALYDFDPEFDIETEAQSGDELAFAHDDLIFVFDKPVAGSWWLAQIDDQIGWVPKNFLEKSRH